MSKRKIRRKKNAKKSTPATRGVTLTSLLPQVNPLAEEADFRVSCSEISQPAMLFMEEYFRAHALMPQPCSSFMDPDEYLAEMGPSVALLDRALNEPAIDEEEILRALGILGHTPYDDAIKALAGFSRSTHDLAPVAELALAECTGMYTEFRGEIWAS